MSLKSIFPKVTVVTFLAALMFIAFTQVSYAATLTLTVNPPVITNGQSATLSWYIEGAVSSCSINNGVGAIDVSSLPASGSMTVTPPENASTDYTLNCDGQVDNVTVATKPVVTLTVRGGNTVTADLDGEVKYVEVEWASEFATKCTSLWLENESTPGVRQYAQSWMHYDYGEVSGVVNFDLTRYGVQVKETSTFYMECQNEITGAEGIGSVTLVVLDPPPPAAPTITMTTSRPTVSIIAGVGSAITDISFTAENVTSCSYKAYYKNGTQYAINPWGWGDPWGGSAVTSYDFDNIFIATTTVFEITCSRAAITIAGTNYPAASITESLTINVVNNVFNSRFDLPPVTVSITATPTPTTRDPITNKGKVTAIVNPRNADYCLTRAYNNSGTEYYVAGWSIDEPAVPWGSFPGNQDRNFGFSLSTSTTLEIECRREIDYISGDPALVSLGTETYQLYVEVVDSAVPAPAPIVRVYGNAVVYNGTAMLSNATVNKFFNHSTSYGGSLSGQTNKLNEITFPFDHPSGDSDSYDVYLNVCDLYNKESSFEVYVAGNLVGSYVTNVTQDSMIVGCWQGAAMYKKRVAAGININDNDLVTIKCSTASSADGCFINAIYFGAGNGGTVTVPRDNVTGYGTTLLLWMTENVTSCLPPHKAYPNGFAPYNWSFSSSNYGFISRQISTTTEFSVTCEQGNGTTATSDVTVALPAQAALVVSALVSAGECIDPISLLTVDAPIGYAANPVTGFCEPAVDLAAVSPAVSIAGAVEDNVNGTYDNLDALIVINNLGPGELVANSNVTYRAKLTFQPVFSLPALDSATGYFNGALVIPSGPSNPTQSPTLTRTFDGVPFGTHTICSLVNLDATNNLILPEASLDPTNNTSCGNVTLPVPPPPMTITSDREIIRTGQAVNIDWSVNVTYELLCTVRGAGGLNVSFDTLNFTNPYTGSFATGPLTSSSEYVLQCTEPITNTTFTESVVVEVVPNYEEI